MLTIGQKFPQFSLTGVVSNDPDTGFKTLNNDSYKGKWLVLFAWPKDFTFVCPTEIASFCKKNKEFGALNAQVLGMSTDSDYVHLAWRQNHPHLNNLSFPMLSDIKRELSTALGILNIDAGVCNRATFIVDPEGVIRHVSVNDLKVGRNVDEVLRVLTALQTDELCQCEWTPGEDTLESSKKKKAA